MHRYLVPALLALSVLVPLPCLAQSRPSFSLLVGTLVDPEPAGQHAVASATLPTRFSRLDLRIDALLASQREGHDDASSASANLVYRPLSRPLFPYLLGGAGISTTGYLALNAGLGWNLPARIEFGTDGPAFPLFAELRGHYVDGTSIMLGVGARL